MLFWNYFVMKMWWKETSNKRGGGKKSPGKKARKICNFYKVNTGEFLKLLFYDADIQKKKAASRDLKWEEILNLTIKREATEGNFQVPVVSKELKKIINICNGSLLTSLRHKAWCTLTHSAAASGHICAIDKEPCC